MVGWVLVTLLTACGRLDDGETFSDPLFDERSMPDVLTEGRLLALPPATDGQRFLAGWWPWRSQGREVLTALENGARVELVHLAARPRMLALDLLDGKPELGGSVKVRAAGRDVGTLAITDPLRIELPADLPLGRVLVELVPSADLKLTVVAAEMRSALPKGDTSRDGDDLLQTGSSFLDMVRRVEPGARLRGVFQPPASPAEGQEFLVHVERSGRIETVFRWRGTLWNRLVGSRQVDVPLGPESGLVRIRLEARGAGPAARWNGFEISSPRDAVGEKGSIAVSDRDSQSPPKLVVLYVLDALRADGVGHLGGLAGATPTLDRLAGEGMTFLDHRSVAPNTLPSTKALLTGEAYVEGGGWRLPEDSPATLAEAFRGAGYATALFSNNPYVSASYGVDRGFDQVGAPAPEPGTQVDAYDDAARIHSAALEWLRSRDRSRPAFLYLHVLHPHNPYHPPPAFRARFTTGIDSTLDGSTSTLLDIQRHRRQADAADRQRLAGLYSGNLAYGDAELSKLLDLIAVHYGREDIFLAVTSDHGEELFDHDGVLHGYTLYEEMIRIPLILWSPGRVAVGRAQAPTSTLDLHATLLQMAGAAGKESEGVSLLAPDVGWPNPEKRIHLAAAASLDGGVFSAQSERFKLIWAPRTGRRWGMGEALGRSRDAEYLFDLENDPEERINLAGEGGLEAAWLRSRLLAWVASKRAASAVEPTVDEPTVDEATRRRLEALGYVD